jgi:acetyl-CoA carboxylase biotin carboxyl carrier protein
VNLVSSDSDAIRRVIEAFEKSSWSEIDVRVGSLRVHLRAGDSTDPESSLSSVRHDESHPRPAPTGSAPASPEPADAPTALAVVDVAADAILVRAPSPGIFWRSPQPGAPPFAEVGRHVDANSTLCIVEVMKLMNHIKAGVPGTVVAVLGRDGVAVDKAEVLFAIHPGDRSI